MRVAVKICGLTRREDMDAAAELGADFVGVVLAGGPRNQSADGAATLLSGVAGPRPVVVVPCSPDPFALVNRVRSAARVDVVQLHGGGAPAGTGGRLPRGLEVWRVVTVPESDGAGERLFREDEAIVLDTASSTGLGGTGRSFDWDRAAAWLEAVGRPGRLVIAGGLTPANVARAVRCLGPDVVDVSSGVESAPGIKNVTLMRRFLEAAWSA